MPKAAPALVTFDAGELSPLLGGRIDLAKYPNACSRMENFIPLIQGPAQRRGGTRFVGEVKNSADRVWLIKFQVAETLSYLLEFGPLYIRFYVNHGQLVDGGGAPVEVVTPYNSAMLTAADGTCRIRVAQSADTMYIFHPDVWPQKLIRTSGTTFTLQPMQMSGGPFRDLNLNPNIILTPTGTTGAVFVNSTSGIFSPQYNGTLLLLQSKDLSAIKPWATMQAVGVGNMRRVGSRVYKCTGTGPITNPDRPQAYTGTLTPTHTDGKAWDGDGVDIVGDGDYGPIGVEWEYQHSSYGVLMIDAYVSPTQISGTVQGVLPADIVTTGTAKWALQLFSNIDGWPEHGAFWRKRLWLGAGRRLAGSVSNDFDNFAEKDPDEATADSAIIETLDSEQINNITWMVPSENLLLGTNGDEWIIGPIQDSQAVSASNIRADSKTANGSRGIQPVKVGERLLFVQNSGRKLRDYVYDYTSNSYPSTDTTKLNPGITKTGIIDLAYQQEPNSIVWAARTDGLLVGVTYDREQERSDIYGWHRHPMTNGAVEAIETIPSPNGTTDELWMVVRRVINGQTKRYVERMEPPLDDEQPIWESFYVDCGLTYRGPPFVRVITGLGHLEGQTVDILVDGAAHPRRVVSGGVIELQAPASIVHVGLPAPCRLDTTDIEAGAANGTSQGKTKRITNVVLRLYRSLGGKVGSPDSVTPAELNFRKPSDRMDQPPPLFSGDMPAEPWPDGYQGHAVMSYVNDQPLPATLLALYPIIETQDDR